MSTYATPAPFAGTKRSVTDRASFDAAASAALEDRKLLVCFFWVSLGGNCHRPVYTLCTPLPPVLDCDFCELFFVLFYFLLFALQADFNAASKAGGQMDKVFNLLGKRYGTKATFAKVSR